ncbi:MAG: ParB/RepB/Spo0J family partition protein [Halobacteriovoraceae bacterium]|nr:ParB/RepB/Spo0J family partition protein [Halobacteriovoraceae bacterium]
MAKKVALGKGIASLIGTPTSQEVIDNSLENLNREDNQQKEVIREIIKEKVVIENTPLMVSVESITANTDQPRKIFKEKELEELSDSIKENGIIQPLIVIEKEMGLFELIAGERRLRAAKLAGLEQVPVFVKRATDREKMIYAIIENVQRSDLNCVEEALAYFQLMEDYKLTQDEVAKKLGKERSTVANFLRILKLPRKVLDMAQKETISFGHAKILASVKDRDLCFRYANQVISQNLSVRELEKLIKTNPKSINKERENPFYEDKMEQFKEQLERKTGFHFAIKSKENGSGHLILKFSNEAEFNDIFEYLVER